MKKKNIIPLNLIIFLTFLKENEYPIQFFKLYKIMYSVQIWGPGHIALLAPPRVTPGCELSYSLPLN